MTPDEKEVRDSWEFVHRCDGSYRDYPKGTILILQGVPGKWWDFPSCAAAAAFTRERKEQIRQVEEEIAYTEREAEVGELIGADWTPITKRILVREQAALAELRKGMR